MVLLLAFFWDRGQVEICQRDRPFETHLAVNSSWEIFVVVSINLFFHVAMTRNE